MGRGRDVREVPAGPGLGRSHLAAGARAISTDPASTQRRCRCRPRSSCTAHGRSATHLHSTTHGHNTTHGHSTLRGTKPGPAELPKNRTPTDPNDQSKDDITPLRGMPKTLAANMDQSLSVPTATSVRTIPAKLLIDNRIVINNHLERTRGGKVSFTHFIGWALIQALKMFPSQNVFYTEVDGKPSIVKPAHIGLGIAIDVPKPDGTRALLVPAVKRAETMTFTEFVAPYQNLVERARANKLTADDFQGATVSLTNPGGIGTEHSIPRLMRGQGCIIGAGALEYPAEFQGLSERTLAGRA